MLRKPASNKKLAARRKYKSKRFRRARSVPDIAKLTESTPLTVYNCVMNQMYQKRDFTISVNPRASAVANAYQHYRIKKVTLIIRPQVDTFVGTVAGVGFTAPNFYYMIDKTGALPTNVTLGALKSMGAKPIRLDDKTIKISWRPSVLQDVQDVNPSAPGQRPVSYKISPWLTTNANALNPGPFVCSSVDHLGIFWYAETPAGPSSLQYNVEAVLDVEYKKPMNSSLTGDVESIKA